MIFMTIYIYNYPVVNFRILLIDNGHKLVNMVANKLDSILLFAHKRILNQQAILICHLKILLTYIMLYKQLKSLSLQNFNLFFV